jgi:DNA-binding SARP family transcriptional activator/tetratricopeptide (TPR) repeat protein
VGSRLEFRILGPLEVRVGGTAVRVGGPKQRALLALLLCHANRVVSRDQLIDELLSEQPAGSAEPVLHVQISRLRKALADGDPQPRLLARPPGYLLRVEDGELDLHAFEQRVAAGRRAHEQGDPGRAAVLLREAESLWHGRPLADLEFEPFARFEVQQLEACRVAAVEDRIEAELALGRHGALCPELGRLVAEHPLRERLRGQLMLALYRSGRQAEALETYRAGRSLLAEELAVEPGPQLKQLQLAILGHDTALQLPPLSAQHGPVRTPAAPAEEAAAGELSPARGEPSPAGTPGRRAGYVAGRVAFVGRDGELSRLVGALGGDARLVLVIGDAGVGKTRFAGEGMARAAAGGMVVVWGECLPLARALPLLPVISALDGLARLDEGRVLAGGLDAAPGFVRGEVGRLLPQLAPGGGPSLSGRDGGWERERLFAGVAELLSAVAEGSGAGVGLVVEDVHWADTATLDLLTFLARPGSRGGVRVVVTCRSDEAPLAGPVASWLARVRGEAGMAEIALGPLSRAESAEQVTALAGEPVPPEVADELFARAEGNPFFTEQLVAAVPTGLKGGTVSLPARLAGLLAARAARCAGDTRAVLDALAVAARPLAEDLLCAVTGLDVAVVRLGLRELAAARLLADGAAPGGGHRLRHALLAEAVAGGLLPGERADLHERTARALEAAGDAALAGEAAGHWQSAGRPVGELPARVAAAGAAERVFGYTQAAAHWQRGIELWADVPGAAIAAGIELPHVYARAIDALVLAGDGVRAGVVAEQAYRRFADYPDPAAAAVVCHRAAFRRWFDAAPARGLPLIEEALRLFRQAPPSSGHAEALFDYANTFLRSAEGRVEASVPVLNRALAMAEAVGANALIPQILSVLAGEAFVRGQVEEGFTILQQAWNLAQAAEDRPALMWVAVRESDALLKLARFQSAADVASRGLGAARRAGLEAWFAATFLAYNAFEAHLALGSTAQAAALVDPLTTGLPDRDHWVLHEARAEIDLLRGDVNAAARRHQRVKAIIGSVSDMLYARESACRGTEVALWAGRPGDALDEVRRVFPLFKAPDLTILCGRLLAAGMRACADLAEQARARRDAHAAEEAAAAAEGLASWVERMGGVPFADHPYMATIAAERATWEAERARLAGPSDPAAWGAAAKAWQDLGCPHRAGYAWWRRAQAQLNAGQPAASAAAALCAAVATAHGHQPLLAQIRALAESARIPLHTPAAPRHRAQQSSPP